MVERRGRDGAAGEGAPARSWWRVVTWPGLCKERWMEGQRARTNAPRSFEECGGDWEADGGRRAKTKAPRSFEERGGGNGRLEGPAGENERPTLF